MSRRYDPADYEHDETITAAADIVWWVGNRRFLTKHAAITAEARRRVRRHCQCLNSPDDSEYPESAMSCHHCDQGPEWRQMVKDEARKIAKEMAAR